MKNKNFSFTQSALIYQLSKQDKEDTVKINAQALPSSNSI